MNKILILGGCGYVGSALYDYLKLQNSDSVIDTVDLEWFGNFVNRKNHRVDFANLKSEELEKYNVFILLAGHSSVKMCDTDMVSSFHNNVMNFVQLLPKIQNHQKLIYASSSSIYGNSGGIITDEKHAHYIPNNYYDLTKQQIDLYASLSDVQYYGLRFGTVNGPSKNLRTDVMINAMVTSALKKGEIRVFGEELNRPILGIQDLVRAINTIIESQKDVRGLYNLASFNMKVGDIADKVSKASGVKIRSYSKEDIEKMIDTKLQVKFYDFSINTNKFASAFNFEFKETVESIAQSLLTHAPANTGNRNEPKAYGVINEI